jgi:hypothetical protein
MSAERMIDEVLDESKRRWLAERDDGPGFTPPPPRPEPESTRSSTRSGESDEDALDDDENLDDRPISALERLRAVALSTDELATIPEPEPLVDGLLYLDSLAMMYGPSGVGKSFVGVDIAMHVASDRQWWHSCKVATAPVLYVAAEGGSGMKLRTNAWRRRHNLTDAVTWIPVAVNVFDRRWGEGLAEYAEEIGARLVIIDTLARSTVGAQENSTQDMGVVVDNLDLIRTRTGACVLNVHHAGKDVTAGARGSSALKAAMDTEIEISGSIGAQVKVKNTKQKNAAELLSVDLKFELIAGTNSGVLVGAPRASTDAIEHVIGRAIVTALDGTEMSKATLTAAIRHQKVKASNTVISDVIALMVHAGDVNEESGPRGAKLLSLPKESTS